MAGLLTDLTSVVTSVIAWAGQVMTFAVGQPLILAYIGMGLFGMAIILIKAFIHR
jgi:hypothetical protein